VLALPARSAAQHASYAPTEIPAHLLPAVVKAEAVFGELQKALLAALSSEIAAGGPVRALSACHIEATPIARRVEAESGILVGRTSHRLRNTDNVAPKWARPFMAQPASGRASDAQPRVIDLGDRVGVLRPIGTVALCTKCHGPRSELADDVRGKLQSLYPNDQAVGFREGDLRGWMWAEVPLAR
jgi:hypothetical protein